MKKGLAVVLVFLAFLLVGCSSTTTEKATTKVTTEEVVNYTVTKGVKYAPLTTSEVADIYIPNGLTSNAPVVVLVHGGAFAVGDETMFSSTAKWLANHGYVVMCISYRPISTNGTFPNAVGDIKAAVRFIRANRATYKVDESKIVLWGESAGAYLAVMAGVSGATTSLDADVIDNSDVSSKVSAIVDFYGPICVKEFQDQGLLNLLGLTKDTLDSEENKEKVQSSDPLSYISDYTDSNSPYFIIEHGDSDTTVSNNESKYLYNGLLKVISKDKVFYKDMVGCHHMDSNFYTDTNLTEVITLLNTYFNNN